MTTVIKHLQQHKQVGCFGSERNETPFKRADCEFILFCFSIVAQRPRVSPPFRLGAADGLLLSLVHGLMRTACDEQNQHWYCIMEFGSHTSGSDMAECRAPADERRKKMVQERQNHNGGKQQGSKKLSNSKD